MSAKDATTLQELVKLAQQRLPKGSWDYLIGGAETETTCRRNRYAIESLAFRPRVLEDVSKVNTSSSLLGFELRIPVVLPPIGSIQVFEAGGGSSVAKAAAEFGTLQFLSSVAEPGLEEVAQASDAPKIFQLYLFGDQDWMDPIIERAINADYKAFCLTVDTQVLSRRERDWLKRWVIPSGSVAGDFGYQARMSWDTVRHIKERFDIPLVLKGIARPEDADRACKEGVEVIYVSNHGGRQLDHGCGCLDHLPAIVEAVAGRAEIIVDGGFLRGTDVVKAIALGATAVGCGRLYCFGLAAGGAAGVVRALEILEHEIQIALALLGVASLDELDPSLVTKDVPLPPGRGDEWHIGSAFPLLD